MKIQQYFANHKKIIIVTLIIITQVLCACIVAESKKEYHIDEIYSYILSNSYNADKISNADNMWGNWIEGQDFDEFVTVQKGEGFSYKTVRLNNSTDCHPPMYYWCLHTICSLFPDHFSKWFGISVNIICFLLVLVFLYLISDELIIDTKLKLLPLIMYGFSAYAIETVTFLRMYMLLTLFATIFVYINIRMLKYGISKLRLILTCIVIYLGAMTQYYLLILSFFGVLLIELYLLKNKKIREMFSYGIGACTSVILMYLSYPYVITQATGSSTNNVGNEVSKNLFNFKLWIKMTYSLAKEFLYKISYYKVLSFIVILVAFLIFGILVINNIRKKKLKSFKFSIESYWIFISVMLTILSISFIGGEYVYLRYIYFVIPFIYIIIFLMLEKWIDNYKGTKSCIICLCILFSVVNIIYGTLTKQSSYLYEKNYNDNIILAQYKNNDAIVILGNKGAAVPTGNFTKLKMFNSVYMDTWDNIKENNIFNECMESNGECVIYINTDQYWTSGLEVEEIFNELKKNTKLNYVKLCDGSLGEFYLISK